MTFAQHILQNIGKRLDHSHGILRHFVCINEVEKNGETIKIGNITELEEEVTEKDVLKINGHRVWLSSFNVV